MKTIDIHAHLVPRPCGRPPTPDGSGTASATSPATGSVGAVVGRGKRTAFTSPKVRFTPEERLRDMDAQGVDVQVLSIHTPFFGYHLDPAQGRALARDVNDEIAALTRQWPQRFAGLATLPVQDVTAAIDELERAVTVLGLKGAELDTVVNGENWDEPKFLPLFKAAEAHGSRALLPPPAPAQLHDGAHHPLRALQQPRRDRRGRDRRGHPDLRRRSRRLPRSQGLHRPRRRPGLLRDGAPRPGLAGPRRTRAGTSAAAEQPTSAASTTTP